MFANVSKKPQSHLVPFGEKVTVTYSGLCSLRKKEKIFQRYCVKKMCVHFLTMTGAVFSFSFLRMALPLSLHSLSFTLTWRQQKLEQASLDGHRVRRGDKADKTRSDAIAHPPACPPCPKHPQQPRHRREGESDERRQTECEKERERERIRGGKKTISLDRMDSEEGRER